MKTVPSRWLNRRVCESALILIVAVSWSGAIYAQDPPATAAATAASTQDAPVATSESAKPAPADAPAASPAPAPVLAAHEPLPAMPALAVPGYEALPPMPAAVMAAHEPRPAPLMPAPAPHAPAAAPSNAAGNAVTNSNAAIVEIIAGRSALVDIGSTISRVSVTDADIADALVTSSSQLLVHGKEPGTISMFVWNTGGVRRYEIAVQRDVTRLSDQLKDLFPRETVHVRSNGKYVVLSGNVSTKEVATKMADVAGSFVEKKDEVVSVLQLQPPAPVNQVMLRVRFAEVSRSALTEFGLGLFTSPTGINNTLGRITTQQFSSPGFSDLQWSKESSEFGAPVTSAEGKFSFSDFLNFFLLSERYDLGVVIKALQTRGLFQSLAEPNLVAESGKEASFLAGGEFPIPVVQGTGNNAAVSVQFKEFGIRLNFVPTVIGDRVHLRVRPEVSTLDFGNAVVMNGFRIPALSTRRTETELELLNNQTFAIAGLINNRVSSTMQKIPGIGDIPILGQLFRSRAAQKDQTELVVMITPQILTTNSVGVTTQLPRLQEPYLPPQPENPRAPQPPPAFQGQAR
jgi:pilus assembly protein CpaC